MEIMVAIDSFKGSLTSVEAGNAVKEAILSLKDDAEVSVFPLADGGEGSLAALHACMGGKIQTVSVTGPLSAPVDAAYCICADGRTAIIEMAAAAGLPFVPPHLRNPMNTTTYGVGELIVHAIDSGCRHFIICLGGSATNDGGVGMLSALGFAFLDSNDQPIPQGAKGLSLLARIDTTKVLPQLKDCTFRVACDVNNPLCGANGASYVYGPQKGADDDAVMKMDQWLYNYGKLTQEISPSADMNSPGAGAAGGLGFAFAAFLNGRLEPGIEIVLSETSIEKEMPNADLVITGEGRVDAQTTMGKAPVGIAALGKKYGKKVIAFCGCTGEGAELVLQHGIDSIYPITPPDTPLEEALNPTQAYRNLRNTVQRILRELL